jgi:hypothetical protein
MRFKHVFMLFLLSINWQSHPLGQCHYLRGFSPFWVMPTKGDITQTGNKS